MENPATKSRRYLAGTFQTYPGWKADLIGGNFDVGGCGFCQNLTRMGGQDGHGWTCAAFPDGIPSSVVLRDEVDHTQPYPGDNGIRYKPRIIKKDGQQVGMYFDWDGTARDAETGEQLIFEEDVR